VFSQVTLFRIGSWFSSKEVLEDCLLLLQQQLQRFHRALRCNDRRYQAWHCATCSGGTKPANVFGACQFYLRAVIETDGSVIIKESNLKHTVCTAESNSAATRKKFTVPKFMADRAAACASVYASYGRKEALVKKLISSQGYSISDFTMACALADANRNECLANSRFGRLVAFCYAFEAIAEANFATVEIDLKNHFVRAGLISEAGVLGVRDGLLSGTVSCDFSYAAAKVRVADAKGSLDEAEDSAGDDEDADLSNKAPVRGRPNMTTADMGRIGVCVGRNYSGNRVILSIGVVSSETKENAEWLLRFTESKVGLLRKYPVVNFITDRSAAIRSAIASVYGDKATVTNCYVHFRRNVIDNTLGSPEVKAFVFECLNKIYYATSEKEFEERMRELHEISMEAYSYVSKVEKSSWVPLFLTFNPLDNVTSNDAETVFAGKRAYKNKGDVFGFIHATLSAESMKLSDLNKDSMKHFVAAGVAQWDIVLTQQSTPEQNSSYDCGVFTCYFANYVGASEPFEFSQDDIPLLRRRLALDLLREKVD